MASSTESSMLRIIALGHCGRAVIIPGAPAGPGPAGSCVCTAAPVPEAPQSFHGFCRQSWSQCPLQDEADAGRDNERHAGGVSGGISALSCPHIAELNAPQPRVSTIGAPAKVVVRTLLDN